MRSKILKILPALFGLAIFILAVRLIHSEIKGLHFQDIVNEFRNIGIRHVVYSFLFTVASYWVLTLYDVLSMRHAKGVLKYIQIAFASFTGYTLSHNLGFSLVTGTAARYRLFSSWGLSPLQIAEALTFSGLIFWLGFLGLAAFVFTVAPVPMPAELVAWNFDLHWLGWLSTLLVGAFLSVSAARKKPFNIFGNEMSFPSLKLTLMGMVVAAIDWTLGAGVLYCLLPDSAITFFQFLSLFQLAQFLGLISHVPGGLGIVEAVVLHFYTPYVSPEKIIGALLAYRLIYYLIPLCISLTMLLIYEVRGRVAVVARLVKPLSQGAISLAPIFLSIAVFGAGAVLLFSGAIPPILARHSYLEKVVPLPIVEVSYFVGSLVGFCLLILAQGLRARLDGAYFATVIALALGVGASLLKGLDFEEAIILGLILIYLISSKKHFYRKSSLTEQVLEPNWIMAIFLVLAGSFALMFFAFKNTPYTHQLWWQFSFDAHAPRALRATVGSGVACLLLGLMKLMRGAPRKPEPASSIEIERARPLIENSPFTHAHLGLVGDKAFLFHSSGEAFLMYAVEGPYWIAMGDPIGNPDHFSDLIWSFKTKADEYGDHAVFYQIRPKYLPLYVDAGFSLLKIGNEALVTLSEFSIEGKARSSLRHSRNRVVREDWIFHVCDLEDVPNLLPKLRQISDNWLKGKKTQEKGFSLGYFKEDYLKYGRIALVKKRNEIVAFANLWAGINKAECSVDLMRFSDDAPQGVMDYLFIELMLWGKKQGYECFNLGMAPLSGLEDRSKGSVWSKIGNVIFRYGEHFYNFQGILNYKEKYKPEWEPRYIASPGGLHIPRVFVNITAVVSGGLRGVVTK